MEDDAQTLEEMQDRKCSNLIFYVRRLSIPFAIIAMSSLFPDVNLILSLFGGSICGVCFIVMPVLFYKRAYVTRPSKKNRWLEVLLGNLILCIAIPIGILGIYMNVEMMRKAPSAGEVAAPV